MLDTKIKILSVLFRSAGCWKFLIKIIAQRVFSRSVNHTKSYLYQEKKDAINRKALCSPSSKKKTKSGKSNSLSKSNILVRPNIWAAHLEILWSTLGKVCLLPGGFDILVKSSCQQTNSGSKNIILRAKFSHTTTTQLDYLESQAWVNVFRICFVCLFVLVRFSFIVVMVLLMSGVLIFMYLWLFWFLLAFATRGDLAASLPLGSCLRPQV